MKSGVFLVLRSSNRFSRKLYPVMSELLSIAAEVAGSACSASYVVFYPHFLWLVKLVRAVMLLVSWVAVACCNHFRATVLGDCCLRRCRLQRSRRKKTHALISLMRHPLKLGFYIITCLKWSDNCQALFFVFRTFWPLLVNFKAIVVNLLRMTVQLLMAHWVKSANEWLNSKEIFELLEHSSLQM